MNAMRHNSRKPHWSGAGSNRSASTAQCGSSGIRVARAANSPSGGSSVRRTKSAAKVKLAGLNWAVHPDGIDKPVIAWSAASRSPGCRSGSLLMLAIEIDQHRSAILIPAHQRPARRAIVPAQTSPKKARQSSWRSGSPRRLRVGMSQDPPIRIRMAGPSRWAWPWMGLQDGGCIPDRS
jgi:hypothetical protein